jgi:hypothetical protein
MFTLTNFNKYKKENNDIFPIKLHIHNNWTPGFYINILTYMYIVYIYINILTYMYININFSGNHIEISSEYPGIIKWLLQRIEHVLKQQIYRWTGNWNTFV